jgi:hypothetical protein
MDGAAKAATINNADANAAIRLFMFIYATSFPAWQTGLCRVGGKYSLKIGHI